MFLVCFSLSLQSTGESGLFKKTISKLSTEYRIQFVWPHCRMAVSDVDHKSLARTAGEEAAVVVDSPKKSKSMGALKSLGGHQQAKSQNLPMVHRKRTTSSKEGARPQREIFCSRRVSF